MDKEMVWVGEPVQRWSAGRKREAVLRLLRGAPVEEVSRELRVSVDRLERWRQQFLEAGAGGLRERGDRPENRELREAQAKIGELTMELELVRQAMGKRFGRAPRRKPGG